MSSYEEEDGNMPMRSTMRGARPRAREREPEPDPEVEDRIAALEEALAAMREERPPLLKRWRDSIVEKFNHFVGRERT